MVCEKLILTGIILVLSCSIIVKMAEAKPIWKDLPFSIPSSSFDYTRFVCSTVIIGVDRHWQGGSWPPPAQKFFHFDHWNDQKSGLSTSPPPGNYKMADEPPGALPWKNSCLRSWLSSSESHILGLYQERRQEFFQGGFPAILYIPGFDFWSLYWSKWKDFSGQGDIALPCQWLPTLMARTVTFQLINTPTLLATFVSFLWHVRPLLRNMLA